MLSLNKQVLKVIYTLIYGGFIMRKILIMFLSSFFILSACSNSTNIEITEEEAKEIVINCHSSDIGEIDIVSVVTKPNKFIIIWENEPLEEGVDSINKKTGKLKTIESSHGSCEWK